MPPVLTIAGRPNVGKSTLFNQLTGSQDALVFDQPGVTRDRHYGEAVFQDHRFLVVDTGGLFDEALDIYQGMAKQAWQAIEESTVVLFLVDAHDGVTPTDKVIAQKLRASKLPVQLIVNKIDGLDPIVALAEFYELGLGEPLGIAAHQKRGINKLLETVIRKFELRQEVLLPEAKDKSIRIAIIGRPNVGKSTLVNRWLGEERMLVMDKPGTTLTAIEIPFEKQGKQFTLIDTAGVRKKAKVKEVLEKFSVIKSLQAIEKANVCVLVLDAREGIQEQELKLLDYVLEAGKALVIAINKWDGLPLEQKNDIKKQMGYKLNFISFAKIHFISAQYGTGVGALLDSVIRAYDSAMKELSTPRLTKILDQAQQEHQPPLVRGRRIKLRYAHAGGSNPPVIVIHGNQTEQVPVSYQRYLKNTFIQVLKLEGTPVRLQLKSSENPFAGKRNKLTPRQLKKRQRVQKHGKKK